MAAAAAAGVGYESGWFAGPQTSTTSSTSVATLTSTTTSTPPEEFRIGYVDALTGDAAELGGWVKRIVDMQVEDFNNSGGIPSGPHKGMTARVIYGDSQTRAEVAISEAQRLITQEKVHVLAGALYSGLTKVVFPLLDQYKIPMIGDTGSSISLNRLGSKWFFRPGPHDGITFKGFLQFMKDVQAKSGVKAPNVGMVYPNNEFGVFGKQTFEDLNKDPVLGGYNIVADIPHDPSASDLTSEILKLKAANADWIVSGTTMPQLALSIQSLWKNDVNLKMFLDFGADLTLKGVTDAVGNLADGLCSKAAWNWDVNKPLSKKWDQMFYAKYNTHIPDGRLWLPFAVIAKAVEQSPSLSGPDLQQTLFNLNIPADDLITTFGIKFKGPDSDEPGMNELANNVVVQYFKDPSPIDFYTVWPFDNASKTVVFPVPTWKERGLS